MKTYLLFGVCVLWLVCTDHAFGLGWSGSTLDGRPCGGTGQGFGPYDYYDVNDETDPLWQEGRLWEIDRVHTDRAIRVLAQSGAIAQGDYQFAISNVDYTLRAIPNHPQALQLMFKLDAVRRRSNGRLSSEFPPPECYLQRAAAYRPGQAHIPLLFGIYLNGLGLLEREIEQYEAAVKLDEQYAEAHYNLGLALVKAGQAAEAVEHARTAYELGFPLPGLRRRLRDLGYLE